MDWTGLGLDWIGMEWNGMDWNGIMSELFNGCCCFSSDIYL